MSENISRREFLAKSGMLAGAAAIPGINLAGAEAPAQVVGAGLPEVYGPKLKFRPDGTFKIVQFTDTHYVRGHRGSPRMFKLVSDILRKEKPDLVVLTGDIVFSRPAKVALKEVLGLIEEQDLPFAYIFGNHDHEYDASQPELYETARSIKGNVMPPCGGEGNMDYAVTVHGSDGKKPAATLYCLQYYGGTPQDRMIKDKYGPYERVSIRRLRGYKWMTNEQISWYSKTSEGITKTLGSPLPAVAFFHVPLTEYRYATQDLETTFIGIRGEGICCPEVNSGMFTAMRQHEDVMATFAGHDHDNDFAAMYHDILLAYGRMSGADTVYNHLPVGARVIVLKEGKREMDSWIDAHDGSSTGFWTYPTSFVNNYRNPDWI